MLYFYVFFVLYFIYVPGVFNCFYFSRLVTIIGSYTSMNCSKTSLNYYITSTFLFMCCYKLIEPFCRLKDFVKSNFPFKIQYRENLENQSQMQYLCSNCGGEIYSKSTPKNRKLKIIKCKKCYELCMNA